jgi:type I restriction enzyme, S subunit
MKSLIGSVPDDWQEVQLGKICEVVTGPSSIAFKAGKTKQLPIEVVTPKDLKHGRIASSTTRMIASVAVDRLDRYQLSTGDIVSVRTGDLGRQGLVEREHEGWTVGTACFRLRPHPPVISGYLLHYLGHPAVRDWILRRASTATVPSLTTSVMLSLPVVVPPPATQTRISELMSALDEKLVIHEQIVRTTEELRDTLLPLLLTQNQP